jgi:hypothetical protein
MKHLTVACKVNDMFPTYFAVLKPNLKLGFRNANIREKKIIFNCI